jgi:hypothetical protein
MKRSAKALIGAVIAFVLNGCVVAERDRGGYRDEGPSYRDRGPDRDEGHRDREGWRRDRD